MGRERVRDRDMCRNIERDRDRDGAAGVSFLVTSWGGVASVVP